MVAVCTYSRFKIEFSGRKQCGMADSIDLGELIYPSNTLVKSIWGVQLREREQGRGSEGERERRRERQKKPSTHFE